MIDLTSTILERAATAMPTVLGSLDALHLVTALELCRSSGKPLAVATHDRRLARVARASCFTVYGASRRARIPILQRLSGGGTPCRIQHYSSDSSKAYVRSSGPEWPFACLAYYDRIRL